MTMKIQSIPVPCRGGLDKSSNTQELLDKPNLAISLVNFECSLQGGYRRISGFQEICTFSESLIYDNGSGNYTYQNSEILGVIPYHGYLFQTTSGLYHTIDGTEIVQVNKEISPGIYKTKEQLASIPAPNIITTFPHETVRMVPFHYAADTYIFGCNTAFMPWIFSIRVSSSGTLTYFYDIVDFINLSVMRGCKYVEIHKNQSLFANSDAEPNVLYYSSLTDTDSSTNPVVIPQMNFEGSTAGFIAFDGEITGIKTHRESVYVFTKDSIFRVEGIDSGSPVVTPVTRQVGCVDGHSIQELDGNLIFLDRSGLRTLAKTDRIQDLELGVISRKIDPIINTVLQDTSQYEFMSTVLPDKNQYRLWFNKKTGSIGQRGIIASYTYVPENQSYEWCYSEIQDFNLRSAGYNLVEGVGIVAHGDKQGRICKQETGNTFAGDPISYEYQTPYVSYGDIGLRKHFRELDMAVKTEGTITLQVETLFDYEQPDVIQPEPFVMPEISQASTFGKAIFGTAYRYLFGSREIADQKAFMEGSGFTMSIRLRSSGDTVDDQFDIQSFTIDLTTGGRI